MRNLLLKKKKASVIENVLVSLISIVMVCAFLVIVFGAFSSINDKWSRTYQKWENGETIPDGYNLLKLMNWLNLSDPLSLIIQE